MWFFDCLVPRNALAILLKKTSVACPMQEILYGLAQTYGFFAPMTKKRVIKDS